MRTTQVQLGDRVHVKGIKFTVSSGEKGTIAVTAVSNAEDGESTVSTVTLKPGDSPLVRHGSRRVRLVVGSPSRTGKVSFGVKFVGDEQDDRNSRGQAKRREKRRNRNFRRNYGDLMAQSHDGE